MNRFNYFGLIKNAKIRKFVTATSVFFLIFAVLGVFFFRPRIAFADTTLGFNEGYGSTVSDSNNNVSGTITNALWRTDELCFDGKCLYFDGSGDFVSFGDDSDLDYAAAANFTIEGWFRTPDITSGTRVLVAKYNSATGTDGGYKVYMDSSGYLIFGIDDDQTSFPEDFASTTTTAFDDSKWHHFAAVKTGTTSITIYVDGVQYQTDSSISATGTLVNTDTFYVGIDGDGASNGYSGFLDQVKVYNSARTAIEIKSDIAGITSNRGISASFNSNNSKQSFMSDGLVGYWKLDEAGDATRVDFSGNDNNLTESASDTIAQTGGKYNNGGDFEQTETEYLEVADASQKGLDLSQKFTMSAWLNPESSAGSFEGVMAKAGGGQVSYAWGVDLGAIRMWLDDDGFAGGDVEIATGGSFLSAGVWSFVAITYDGTYIRIYKDGVEQTSGSFPYATSTSIHNGTAAFRLGNWESQSQYYDGIIDEARVYNRSLAPSEIAALYNWAPGPVGWWKLDETTGAAGNDSSGNNNNLTDTGTVARSAAKFGNGIKTDNTETQYLSIANGSQTGLSFTSSYTIGFWINIDSNEACDDVIGKSGSYGFYLACGGNSSITGWYYNGSTSPEVESAINTVTNGNWAHIEFVHNDLTDTDSIYINGVLSSSATGRTTNPVTSANSFMIGGTSNFPAQLNGKMDNVMIYNYARSPSQVVQDMNGGHPSPGSPIGSSVAYWKVDDGSGTTAQDSSENNNDLTLSTASWTNSGKFGKAFNGLTNVRMSRADDDDLDFASSDDASFSFWFKSDSATNPSANEYLLEKGGNITTDAVGYAIYTSAASDGLICFGIDDDTASFPEDSVCSTSDYYDNTWHHVTAIKTGTSRLDLYIDGNSVGTPDTSISSTGTLANAATFYMGDTNGTDGTDEFLGDLDEVKIFRGALTATEVKALYAQSSQVVLGALGTTATGGADNSKERSYCPPGDATAICSPIGEWLLDENTGTTSKDTTSVGNSGSFSGAPIWLQGKVGQALRFDGTDDYVNVPYSASQDPAANLTVSFWFKPTVTIDSGIGSNKGLLSKANTNTDANNDWVFFWNTADVGRMRFGTYGDNIQTTNATWTAGTWYHIEVVVTGTNTANIYVNGKLDTYNADSDITTDPINGNQNTALNIGLARVASGDLYFSGAIDDLKLYDYARSVSQITWDYNRGAPVGWWKMDETSWNGTASEVKDSSGNVYHGVRNGNATTTSLGKYNYAGTFDGTGDYVTIAESDSDGKLDFNSGDQFSVSLWINPTSLPGAGEYDTYVGKNDADDGWYFQIDENGKIEFFIGNGANFHSFLTTSNYVTAGSWQHIAFSQTVGTDSTALIYYNGNSVAYGLNGTADLSIPLNNFSVEIGANGDGSEAATGKIDDFRIYNYILTTKQLKTTLGEGAIRFGP